MIECNQQCEGPLVLLTTEKATRVICFLSFVLCGQLIINKFYIIQGFTLSGLDFLVAISYKDAVGQYVDAKR